ncbi:MAG: M15 family metallopeptidase [Ignavibacteria bacterium]|nr:M15 family metallopeptidase [Ignavibacteria bacterium]
MANYIFIVSLFILLCNPVKQSYRNIELNNIQSEERADYNNKFSNLIKAYPDFLDSVDSEYLYWKDGTVMKLDDGIKDKSHDEKLDNPDIEDMLSQNYPKGREWNPPPPENFEPGRIRYEAFFKKMYGSSSHEVKKNLVTVHWLPSICNCKVQFNKINGAAEKLKAVSDEIESKLGKEFHKYLSETAGTFNWRNIAGTTRLSTHAFGTAIDINTKYSNYWKWDSDLVWKNQIPMEIVEIFEKHGFIWGGKWYHYDTMHFEYRPELLID